MDRSAEDRFAQWAMSRAPVMQRFAFLMCGDWQVAEDLVQEAFTSCAVRWRRLEKMDNPDAYLRTAVMNKCRSNWRRRGARTRLVSSLVDQPVDDGADVHADRSELMAALSQLPIRQRAVVVLRYYEDMSEAEAAAVLGCTAGTIKSQTHKALRSLRALIELERQTC